MVTLQPNAEKRVGAIAIFYYATELGPLKHVAYVEAVTDDGFFVTEANYDAGEVTARYVDNNDYALAGFMLYNAVNAEPAV